MECLMSDPHMDQEGRDIRLFCVLGGGIVFQRNNLVINDCAQFLPSFLIAQNAMTRKVHSESEYQPIERLIT